MPDLNKQHNDALSIVESFRHKKWATSYAQMILLLPAHLPWTEENIKLATKEHLDKNGLSLKDVTPFLRAALTGEAQSEPIFNVIYSLGAQASNMRICNPDNTAKWRLILQSDKPKIVSASATMEAVTS